MSKVDWSLAPEGAEFFSCGGFYKHIGGHLHHFDGYWNLSVYNSYERQSRDSYESRPLTWPESDTRITHIAQNGGDGMHYDEQREQHEAKHDPVNHPRHYAIAPGVEAIDIIEASLTPEQFKGYLLGNFLKYRLRAGDKGDLQQDIDKSNWYRQKLTGQTSQA